MEARGLQEMPLMEGLCLHLPPTHTYTATRAADTVEPIGLPLMDVCGYLRVTLCSCSLCSEAHTKRSPLTSGISEPAQIKHCIDVTVAVGRTHNPTTAIPNSVVIFSPLPSFTITI